MPVQITRVRRFLLAALLLQPLAVNAQTPPTFSVSVTEPYELVEEVGTIRRLSRADIETRNARTLDEALRLLPGVTRGSNVEYRLTVKGTRQTAMIARPDGTVLSFK